MIAIDLSNKLQNSPLINAIVPSSRIYFKKPLNAETVLNEPNYISFNRVSETGENGCVEVNNFQLTVYAKSALELEQICEAIKQTFKYNNSVFNSNVYFRCTLLNRVDGIDKLNDGFYWSQMTYDFSQVVG